MRAGNSSNPRENVRAGHILAQLEVLHTRVTKMRDKFGTPKIRVTKKRIEEFQTVAGNIAQAAAGLSKAVQTSMELLEKDPTDDDVKLLTKALQCDLEEKLPMKSFGNNIIRIFEDPKDSALDSSQTKARKKLLRARCNTIRNLRPAVIVRWARSFGPSVWAAGIMSQDTFDYLVEQLESEVDDALPPHVCAILHTLGAEVPLNQCHGYRNFLAGE